MTGGLNCANRMRSHTVKGSGEFEIRHRLHVILSIAVLAFSFATAAVAQGHDRPPPEWFGHDEHGEIRVDLYFFRSLTCPHCRRAAAFLSSLDETLPWLRIHDHEITTAPANAMLFQQMAAASGANALYVPAFFICGVMRTGFDAAETTGAEIIALALECKDHAELALKGASLGAPPSAVSKARGEDSVDIPLLGTVSADRFSLPVLTVVLATLDGFNPCAFFVLLFLLSLLVHVRSRARMAMVGGTFVFFSGLIYFLFMAAWLNLFVVIGHLQAVTLGAGLVALVLGGINIKDFFWSKKGVSLSISTHARGRLFERMRKLVGAPRLPVMLAGTVALAVAANGYELLCTAGFPMVFTRALTLHEVSPTTHYLYLALYNVIYVVPLAVIVVAFTVTLGSRKLSEHEGRILKLISGLMMLGLGSVLMLSPELLSSVWVAVTLIVAALATTAVIVLANKGLGAR